MHRSAAVTVTSALALAVFSSAQLFAQAPASSFANTPSVSGIGQPATGPQNPAAVVGFGPGISNAGALGYSAAGPELATPGIQAGDVGRSRARTPVRALPVRPSTNQDANFATDLRGSERLNPGWQLVEPYDQWGRQELDERNPLAAGAARSSIYPGVMQRSFDSRLEPEPGVFSLNSLSRMGLSPGQPIWSNDFRGIPSESIGQQLDEGRPATTRRPFRLATPGGRDGVVSDRRQTGRAPAGMGRPGRINGTAIDETFTRGADSDVAADRPGAVTPDTGLGNIGDGGVRGYYYGQRPPFRNWRTFRREYRELSHANAWWEAGGGRLGSGRVEAPPGEFADFEDNPRFRPSPAERQFDYSINRAAMEEVAPARVSRRVAEPEW